MVQVYVSQLRRLLPESRLHTRAPGYLLAIGPDEVDVQRFERLADAGRTSLSDGNAADAAGVLRQALALWRGPPLAELSEPFARQERARLEELHLSTLESRIAADLALGRHDDLVGELDALIAQNPLRERLRAHHMLALYRSGRHPEALASYRAHRQMLADELGIETSASLRELERQILRQDPALDVSVTASPAAPGAPRETEIRYARSGDVRIAYQLVGDGPVDLILVHGWVCSFQPGWENPRLASFYRGLASMGRLILFDKRGTGLSDRVSPDRLPDLETRMDDVRAVMDAAGSERAVVLGVSEGGSMSTLFAATYPDRTVALVLMGAFARVLWAPDYPIGVKDEEYRTRLAVLDEDDWARHTTEEWLGRVGPGMRRDEASVRWYVSYLMRSASPAAGRAIRLMNAEIDIRGILATIAVPALVLYRAAEYHRDATRFLGARIPEARLVELPGDDHLPWEGDREEVLTEIERFVAGVRHELASDRVLATLLCIDVVGCSANSEALRGLQGLALGQLARSRGRRVETPDDAVFATFDGPARAVRCAAAIVSQARGLGLELRAGVHTGEVQRTGDDVLGIAVDIAAGVRDAAQPGEVLVSGTVKDIVAGSGLTFEVRGERELSGVPGTWRLYSAVAG
jgi:pimeloyl-ACP methyl ester carboxylesterase/DNA-binding SARP family transcriptional activator